MKTFEEYSINDDLYHFLLKYLKDDLEKTFNTNKISRIELLDGENVFELSFNYHYEDIKYSSIEKEYAKYQKENAQNRIKALDFITTYLNKLGVKENEIGASFKVDNILIIFCVINDSMLFSYLESILDEDDKNKLKSLLSINKFNL